MSQERNNLSPTQGGGLRMKDSLMRPSNNMLPQVSPSVGSNSGTASTGSKFFNKGPVKPSPAMQMLPTEAMIRQSPQGHPFGMT